jgi:hypothetical protein
MCKRGEESRIYEIFASSTVKDGIINCAELTINGIS